MAVLMVFSTISLTVHHWYCQGNLVDTTFFENTSCCDVSDCDSSYIVTSNCCEHEEVVIQGQNNLQHQKVGETLLKKHFFVNEYTSSVLQSLKTHTKKVLSRKQYIPPKIIIDRLSVYQTFTI